MVGSETSTRIELIGSGSVAFFPRTSVERNTRAVRAITGTESVPREGVWTHLVVHGGRSTHSVVPKLRVTPVRLAGYPRSPAAALLRDQPEGASGGRSLWRVQADGNFELSSVPE
jgi:hypothetical protein